MSDLKEFQTYLRLYDEDYPIKNKGAIVSLIFSDAQGQLTQ